MTCSNCNNFNSPRLTNAVLVCCSRCGNPIGGQNNIQLKTNMPPPDWSFIQVGSGGKYENDLFTITGRVRLQLKNDYKNIWTASTRGRKVWLIIESFASVSVFEPVWHAYTGNVQALRAGKTVAIPEIPGLEGEYVEKCFDISYEGEIAGWHILQPHFFLVNAANRNKDTVFFPFFAKEPIRFLKGKKVETQDLALTNIRKWDEWQ